MSDFTPIYFVDDYRQSADEKSPLIAWTCHATVLNVQEMSNGYII